jgi:hypothetical protein
MSTTSVTKCDAAECGKVEPETGPFFHFVIPCNLLNHPRLSDHRHACSLACLETVLRAFADEVHATVAAIPPPPAPVPPVPATPPAGRPKRRFAGDPPD